ncbi:hypothetical protein LOAG_12022 [Loa loa]|uniref:Uncharacterized protein n=1 Tax=Loa loa TaxID=7209 RepID=A0A1S0TMH0_LOALO|nr:hypothetical protein LOAG_12022 [Loa loa]EFO16484.1 hypothetical protein LOAG_12022 [Loa loa]
MTPVKYDAEKIMQTFIWTALLLLTCSIFSTFSAYFFSILIRQIIGTFVATICAYVLLPLITCHYINKLSVRKYAWNDMILRHALLTLSMVEGLLTGYILSNRILHNLSPFAALTPFFIGIIAPLLHSARQNERSLLILITIIGSFTCHIAIGILFGLTFPYILLTVFYTMISFITLQLLIANNDGTMVFTHIYQFAILYFSLLAESFVYKLFGTKS